MFENVWIQCLIGLAVMIVGFLAGLLRGYFKYDLLCGSFGASAYVDKNNDDKLVKITIYYDDSEYEKALARCNSDDEIFY